MWGHDTFLIMSEAAALDYLATRNNIKFDDVKVFLPEQVYCLDLDTLKLHKGVDLKEERTKKYQAVYSHHPPPWNPSGSEGSGVLKKPLSKKKLLNFQVTALIPGWEQDQVPMPKRRRISVLLSDLGERSRLALGGKGYGKINNFTMTDQGEHRYYIKYGSIVWGSPNLNTTPLLSLKEKIDQNKVERAEAGGPQREGLFLSLRDDEKFIKNIGNSFATTNVILADQQLTLLGRKIPIWMIRGRIFALIAVTLLLMGQTILSKRFPTSQHEETEHSALQTRKAPQPGTLQNKLTQYWDTGLAKQNSENSETQPSMGYAGETPLGATILQSKAGVLIARNKVKTFVALKTAGVAIPDFTTNKAEAMDAYLGTHRLCQDNRWPRGFGNYGPHFGR